MRSFKRFATTATFLFLTLYCIAATSLFVDSRPGINGGFGGAFTLPTADYLCEYPGNSTVEMPPSRTSYGYNVDIKILDFTFSSDTSFSQATSLGLGLSFMGVSRSLAFGSSVLNAYHGVGVFIKGNVTIGRIEMGIATKLFKCEFMDTKNAFIAGEIEIAPSFKIATFSSMRLSLALPVSMLFKTDAFVLRVSCAVSLDYSMRGFTRGET